MVQRKGTIHGTDSRNGNKNVRARSISEVTALIRRRRCVIGEE